VFINSPLPVELTDTPYSCSPTAKKELTDMQGFLFLFHQHPPPPHPNLNPHGHESDAAKIFPP
jgi:hypothetical protein